MFTIFKRIVFNCEFVTKVTCPFLLHENISELSELNIFKPKKKGFKVTDVNLVLSSLHGGSLEIMSSDPLKTETEPPRPPSGSDNYTMLEILSWKFLNITF